MRIVGESDPLRLLDFLLPERERLREFLVPLRDRLRLEAADPLLDLEPLLFLFEAADPLRERDLPDLDPLRLRRDPLLKFQNILQPFTEKIKFEPNLERDPLLDREERRDPLLERDLDPLLLRDRPDLFDAPDLLLKFQIGFFSVFNLNFFHQTLNAIFSIYFQTLILICCHCENGLNQQICS